MSLCTQIEFYMSLVGGSPLSPAEITFTQPTDANQVEVVTVYAQNSGSSDIPQGALVYMASPYTTSGDDPVWYKRMQDCNCAPNVQFSTDNVNFFSRAYLPAMDVGSARVPVYVQYNSPGWDNRQEMGGSYSYPGDTRDWPPRVRLEVAVQNHVLQVESFEHWADNDHPDNFLIATKWDTIWLDNLSTRMYLDSTGGVRGGKAFYCTCEEMGLDKSSRGMTQTNTEFFNIGNWGVMEGAMIQFRVQMGEGTRWTDDGTLIAYVDASKFFNGSYQASVYWWMGADGHILAKLWNDTARVTLVDIAPTWDYEEYVTLGLAMQLHPGSAAPNYQFEYGFLLNGSVVAHGICTCTDTYVNPRNRISKMGIGPFEWTEFTDKWVRLRFCDVVVAEPAAPLNACFLPSSYQCIWLPVVSDGSVTDWPGTHPFGDPPYYTYVDEPAWNETDWVYARHDYPSGSDYSARPMATFHFAECPSGSIYAVQPMRIGGATNNTGSGGSSNYCVTPLLYDPDVGSAAVVNQPTWTSNSGPWEIALAPLEADPYTGLAWSAAALNRLQVGAQVAGCAYNDGYMPVITQIGVEVLLCPQTTNRRSWVSQI